MVEKLKSRKLWVLVFGIALAAIDDALAKELFPLLMTYLAGQSFVDGVGSMTASK